MLLEEKNTKVVAACSAARQRAHPLIILKRKNIWNIRIAAKTWNTLEQCMQQKWMGRFQHKKKICRYRKTSAYYFNDHAIYVDLEEVCLVRSSNISIIKLPAYFSPLHHLLI
jgi:hypothetical protein